MNVTSIAAGDVPPYDVLGSMGMRHAWDFFGCGDQLGTLNYLTPEVIAAAVAAIGQGVVITLTLPLNEPSPPLFGRDRVQHTFFRHDRNTWDDRLDAYFPQGSSQWDGFRHVRAREHGFFGGVEGDPSADASWLGVDRWAQRGIVGRGVLLDVGHYLARAGTPLECDIETAITVDLLCTVAAAQGVRLRHGDLLLVRTGWPAQYRVLPAVRREKLLAAPAFPGLHAGEDMARLLWNWQVSALITDVPAVESVPGDPSVGSLHRRLLPLLGLPLGELFDLERLAAHCRSAGTYSFVVTSAPMNLPGGCGSPSNALAIF